jgi:uncharacterized RDD family membrane protein YckC
MSKTSRTIVAAPLAALLLVSVLAVNTALAARERDTTHIAVAGTTEKLFIIQADTSGEFTIYYREPSTPETTLYRFGRFKGRPIAATAYGRTLYVVYDDRSVQSFRFNRPAAAPNTPTLDIDQLRPLPDAGQFIGWSAGRSGPVALIRNEPFIPPPPSLTSTNKPAAPSPAAAAGSPEKKAPAPLTLLRLHHDAWSPLPLPESLEPQRVRLLVMADASASRPALVSDTREHAQTIVDTFDGSKWSRLTYKLKLASGAQATSVQNNICLVQPTEENRGRRLAAYLLRGDTAAQLGSVDLDPSIINWFAANGADDLAIIGFDTGRRFQWTQLDIEKTVDTAKPMTPLKESEPPFPLQNPLQFLVIGAVVLGMMFLFATARRDPKSNIPRLPRDVAPSTAPRLAAAVIDMLPPIAFAFYLYGSETLVQVLQHWAQLTIETAELQPTLAIIGPFVLHTTLTELFTGRTLGKAITGCRVTNLTGGPPHLWQVLTRNFFKIVELVAPLLLVMPLLGTHHQRLGDLIAGTVVIGPGSPPASNTSDLDEGF